MPQFSTTDVLVLVSAMTVLAICACIGGLALIYWVQDEIKERRARRREDKEKLDGR